MYRPSLRFLVIPLCAVAGLIALSMQPAASKVEREATSVREQVDCAARSASEVCVIQASGGERTGSTVR